MRYLDCYTDASVCLGRSLVCSAFIVKNEQGEIVHSGFKIYSGQCNNHGELMAILECLTWLDSQNLSSYSSVFIKSDSKDSVHLILHTKPRQGVAYSISNSYLKIKNKLNDHLKIIHVKRSQVQLAHSFSRRMLKAEIEKIDGSREKQKSLDKRIERQWILSKWMEVCK